MFSKFDLKLGCHQPGINSKDISKIVFRTRFDHYGFTMRPYDLTNAPMDFIDYINGVLDPI